MKRNSRKFANQHVSNKVYTTEEAKEVYIKFTKAITETSRLLRELNK